MCVCKRGKQNERETETHTSIISSLFGLLQAYILFCLQSTENHAPVFGLVAVRLASLNQTLNPWIYVILRKSLLARFRRMCCSCLDDPDLPLPRRKAPQYPHMYRQPAQGKGRPHNYVHVGHQLCPSSQFVGQRNDALSLSEGHRKKSKGSGSSSSSGRSRSKGEKSRGEGSKGCGTFTSGSCTDEKKGQGSTSCSCATCRAVAGNNEVCSHRSLTCSHPSCCRGEPCSDVASPECGALCNESSAEPTQPLFPSSDGIYVDLFRQLPSSEDSDSRDVSQNQNDVSKASCRSQVGRVGAAAPANVNSSISEADDHGYASKVSTDSSRTSTPEYQRSAGREPGDGTTVLSVQHDEGCSASAPADRRLSAVERAPVASGRKNARLEHKSLLHVKHKGCKDDSVGFSSGVFDSQDASGYGSANCCGDGGQGRIREREGDGGGNCSRRLSSTSAGTHTEPSSGHDRTAAISRQLSTSSGQKSVDS